MARTQSPDYDKRRDRIIDQAARLYAMRGFNGASVADLAKACKTSKSLIYHYFPSKEDILFEVMYSHLDDLVAISKTILSAPAESPEARFRALISGFMKAYIGAAYRHRVLLNELDNLPPNNRKKIVSLQRDIICDVEKLLLEIRPELKGRADLKRPIVMICFGMINWTHTWFNPKGPMSHAELAELAYTIMLGGLRALPL